MPLPARDLDSPAAWEALRATDGVFGLPTSREQWAAAAASHGLAPRAAAIAAVVRDRGVGRLGSYGVGVAYLEKNLVDAEPAIDLVCTDVTPNAIERLRGLFPEASFVVHDLRSDPPLDVDLHLFHRIDTEFPDIAWRGVFARYCVPVLLVAGELLDGRRLARELATRVLRPRSARAGWIRTEAALRALWEPTHEGQRLRIGDLTGYLLTPHRGGQARV